jgi:hypothetical protein
MNPEPRWCGARFRLLASACPPALCHSGASHPPSSFRGDAKHRARNPEVTLARFRVRAAARPGMTRRKGDESPRRYRPPGACQSGPERVAKALFRDLPELVRNADRAIGPKCQAKNAPVAQLDRALDYESRGQEFESLRARQIATIQNKTANYPTANVWQRRRRFARACVASGTVRSTSVLVPSARRLALD